MPEVSLIIPVYNVEPYLYRCIDSIAKQTFTDFEAIFVNDGATDNSAKLCKKLIAEYSNMRLISKRNGGLSSARLYGLHNSEGKYVVFIDSDDYLHKDYLRTLRDLIVETNAQISMCSYYTENEIAKQPQSLYFREDYLIIENEDIFSKYVLPQLPSTKETDVFLPSFMWLRMFRKDILSDNLFISEREVFQEDLAMSLMLYKRISKIVVANIPLYYYCINQGSLTMKYRDNLWEMKCRLYDIICNETKNCTNPSLMYRKDGFLFSACLLSLKNASLKGLSFYIKEVKKIINSNIVRDILSHSLIKPLPIKYRLFILSVRLHLTVLMYKYYHR